MREKMLFFVILPSQILIKVALGAIIASIALSLVGTLVVQLKITNIGYSMSHAAFAGASFGIWLNAYLFPNFDEQITALIFTLITALILGPLSDKTKLSSEVILGALFSLLTALGFIFLSTLPSGVITQRAVSVLWGSLFGLRYIDFLNLGLIIVGFVIILVIFYREFLAIVFHEKIALAAGIRVGLFKFLVLAITALIVSISMKIVGALLVYALIIMPTSTAYQFLYDFKKILYTSPLFGALSAVLGLFLSLATNFPISSSMILISCIIFLIAVGLSPKRRILSKEEQDVETIEKKDDGVELSRVIEYFNERANNWDEHIIHDPEKLEQISAELEIKTGYEILDVGTGTGVMIPYLQEKIGNSGKIIALDVSDKMIEISRKKFPQTKYPNVDFLIQDVHEYNSEKKFDIILCYSCFPHFMKQSELVYKLVKKLKMGGKLMIAHSQSRDAINSLHGACEGVVSEHRLPPIREISKMMRDSGLQIVKSLDNQEIFYIMGALKQ